ncbi:MAG: GGDEF domain-containing protein [Rhodospirillaceae bacterium]|nr:GGDEF domain-containing protein [Rhodospirillaceae bacterium]
MDVNKAETIRSVGDPPHRNPGQKPGKGSHDQTQDDTTSDNREAPRTAPAVALDGLPIEGLTPDAQRIIDALAAQIEPMRIEADQAKAQAARYHELATRHPILSVPNRREFERELQHVIDHLDSLSPSAALMIVHPPLAEALRTEVGRAAADAAMARVVELITEAIHPTDTVGSLCGYDLGVILLNGDPESVALRTESLHRRFQAQPFTWHDKSYPLDARIGAAILHPGWQAAEAIAAADRHLLSRVGG